MFQRFNNDKDMILIITFTIYGKFVALSRYLMVMYMMYALVHGDHCHSLKELVIHVYCHTELEEFTRKAAEENTYKGYKLLQIKYYC